VRLATKAHEGAWADKESGLRVEPADAPFLAPSGEQEPIASSASSQVAPSPATRSQSGATPQIEKKSRSSLFTPKEGTETDQGHIQADTGKRTRNSAAPVPEENPKRRRVGDLDAACAPQQTNAC